MEYMSHTETNGLPSFAHGLQILLVDHDILSLMCIASTLEQYSFKVATTQEASVALSMVKERKDHYKLVMANINMPDMDSLSFLRLLRNKEIPVIFMSSEMNVNVARKALTEGACFFLEKPISLDDLKNLWQHVYRKIRNPMKDSHKPTCEKKMNCGKDLQGIKINEAAVVLRPPLGGIRSKEVGGGVRRPATGHDLHVDPQNTWTLTSKSGKVCVGDGNQERELQCSHIEAPIPTESQKQREYGMKRPIDDKEEQEKAKKIKSNVKQTVSESISKNEEGIENQDSNGSSSDKKSRAIWTPELHLKFTAALSALGEQKARPKLIHKMMNVPDITVRQVASHLQKFKNQVRRIRETGRSSLPSLNRTSSYNNRNEFLPVKPSSLVCQYGQGTSSFGVRGNAAQLTIASFNNHDYRRQNLYSGHTTGMSHYTNHYTYSLNEFYSRTHGQVQNLTQIRETSSFEYGTDMNEIMKKNQPLGLDESRLRVSQSHLPSMNYMTPDVAAPYISANTFQLPNVPPFMNQEQYFTPALTGPFNSQNQNQLSTEVTGTTEGLELVPEQIASSNAANAEKFPADMNDGSQKLDTTAGEAPPASSSNQNQLMSEYAELLKLLEEDPEDLSWFGSAANAGDVDHYCEWLTKTSSGNSNDPQ